MRKIACLLFITLLSPSLLADRATGPGIADINARMTRISQEFLATMEGTPTPIETAVGYNRRELAALAGDDPARTNYVY